MHNPVIWFLQIDKNNSKDIIEGVGDIRRKLDELDFKSSLYGIGVLYSLLDAMEQASLSDDGKYISEKLSFEFRIPRMSFKEKIKRIYSILVHGE